MKQQRGAATLLAIVCLLALAALVVLYGARHVVLEHFNAQAQQRYHVALGNAELGLFEATRRLADGDDTPPAANARFSVRYQSVDDKTLRVVSEGLADGHRVSVQQSYALERVPALELPCGKHGGKAARKPQHDPVLAVTGTLDFFGSIHQAHGSAGAQAASCFPVGQDKDTGSSNPPPNDSLPDWGAALEKDPPPVNVPNASGAPLDCKRLQQAIASAQGGVKPWVIEGPVELSGSCPIDAKGQPQDIVIVGDVKMTGTLSLMQANLLIIGNLIGRPMSSVTVFGTANGFDFDRVDPGEDGATARPLPGSWIDSGGEQ